MVGGAAAGGPDSLAALRGRLDGIDAELHALLMRRAAIVAEIGANAAKGAVKLRPGREAAILHARLAAHAGKLPPATLVRLWRELFAGTTAMQGPFSIAVVVGQGAGQGDGLVALSREHFGALTPVRTCAGPSQALAELDAGATAALLPLPAEGEAAPWWPALMHDSRRQVVARLPVWSARPEGTPRGQGLVVAAVPPDPSGADRTLLGLELPAEASRDRIAAGLAADGLAPLALLLRRERERTLALVEVDGLLDADDPRLGRHPARAVRLGGYAVPLDTTPETRA